MKKSVHRAGVLLVTASAVVWSLGGLFTRLVHLDSWTMVAWRGVFGAASLAIVLAASPRQGMWRGLIGMGWVGWLFVAQSSAGMTFYLAALRHTTVASVAVIYATTPFVAAAVGWLALKERPTASAVFASIAALAGVAVMVGFGGKGGLLGDLFAVGGMLSMAVATVVARSFRDIPVLLTACLSSLLSGLICWPIGAPLSVGGHDIFLLALFGVFNFAIGLPLFVRGAQHLPAIETALIGAMDAPLSPLWVWLVFRETPSASTLIGGSIVFAAVALHLGVGESAPAGAAT